MREGAFVLAAKMLLLLPLAAAAGAASLPSVAIGPRPGPEALYAPPAVAPELANDGIWTSAPILVSGASVYAGGEWIYQDYVYDSYGANTSDLPLAQPDTVPAASDTLFGGASGDLVYPTDASVYAFDAADLLELRVRTVSGGVAYRITLNTMLVPDAAGVVIGIDTDRDGTTGTNEWGYGIGNLGTLGLEHRIVTWGTGAELDGVALSASGVSVDVTRNQIEVIVPLDPAGASWRHYVGVGLFDSVAGAFKQVGNQPTATHPGGAHDSDPPPLFNVGFRFELEGDEPMGSSTVDAPERGLDTGARGVGFGHWRDHGQAKALAARDLSTFSADIDFQKLADGIDDDSNVPVTGHVNRLFVSRFEPPAGTRAEGAQDARPMLLGRIQPYALYVPSTYDPAVPAPLTLVLHSLSSSYNQYAVYMPQLLRQLGEERGSILLTTENRGPDGWYHDAAELDLFEAWADAARHYAFDPDRVTVSGYSMGGYATFKMASQYPDLFSKGFAIVGPADENPLGGPTAGVVESAHDTYRIAENLWNVPLLLWNGLVDELVPVAGVLRYEERLHELGNRHELDLFPTHDHFLFGTIDRWGPARDFLIEDAIDRDPSRVVFRAMPEMDNAALGLVHDHAYWVGDVTVAAGARSGLVDARSRANGEGLPGIGEVLGAGTDPTPHVKRGIVWSANPEAAANELIVKLADVASATLWIERAGIDVSSPVTLSIESNGAATLTLAGTFGTEIVNVPAGASTTTLWN